MTAASDKTLPPLREDLVLTPAARTGAGAPVAVLTDGMAGAHYTLGWLEQEIVARWPLGTAEAIAADIARTTTLSADTAAVATVHRFLEGNGLLRLSGAEIAVKDEEQRQRRRAPAALIAAVLFQRLPLVRPQRFLDATLPLVAPLFTRSAVALCAGLLLLALYLVSREFAHFLASFQKFLGGEGALGIALALTVAKVFHELGHAYATARLGVAVPSMGVSLMLGWPLLYTDTSGIVRVQSRRSKALVAAAGVLVEMMLATLALLAWTVVDDGPLRRTLLFMATSMIVLTVVVNANPLMRFDGYFILSEALGMENLQTRAFGAFGWVMRRLGAGGRPASPEPALSSGQFAALALFGAASALYRIGLYLGIALTLHSLGFSAAALPAAAAVLAAFLIWPILKEVAMWFRAAMARLGPILGVARVLAVLTIPAAILGVPWQTGLVLPAVWQGAGHHDVYAPEAGQLARFTASLGAKVASGNVLAAVISPDLMLARARTDLKVRTSHLELARRLTGDRSAITVKTDELATLISERVGYDARLARLELSAAADGRIAELSPGIAAGVWVNSRTRLGRIVTPRQPRLLAYVSEAELDRVQPGTSGTAWLDGMPDANFAVRVIAVAPVATAALDEPVLAAAHGGSIDARPAPDGTLVPELALYRIDLDLTGEPPPLPERVVRAQVRLVTPATSLGLRLWTKIVGLWRREFG